MKVIKLALAFLLLFSTSAQAGFADKLVAAAKNQIGITRYYDPSYVKLDYPGGDVDKKTGVCADVIIRAYRDLGIDLQKELHEDMKKNFDSYPRNWGLKKPDSNIDHRRVPNLQTFFKRHGQTLPLDKDFNAGDIVIWNLNPKGFTPHIGIVSDKKSWKGNPLIIHNICCGAQQDDILFQYKIIGHYKYDKN
ncbi:MAG: DUF1287 domain-containing protein [Lactobacillus sp.]|jgi:uncharacterized protein YijF (DUF1287 family)|nr:DUF1287 domain-containing protein [Lactobacillus sp.]